MILCCFFFYCSGDHRDLHSFPTRRSSDLALGVDNWAPWDCEPSVFDWEYDCEETAYIKEGKVTVSSPEGTVTLPSLIYADRKSTRLNSSHVRISYAVFCLKKKKNI